MAKTQRLYDFQNGTRTDADQVDAEFDNLVKAHNELDDEIQKKVSVDGDFKGTWNGVPYKEADPLIAGRVSVIEDMIQEEEKATVTLVRGENTITVDETASLSVMEILGDEVKNVIPTFDSGTWSGDAVTVNSPDKITVAADGMEKIRQSTINVTPNTTYYLSGKTTLAGTHIELVVGGTTIKAPNKVVVPSGVSSATVRCVVTNTAQGTATFEQVQLSVGETEREYVAGYQPIRNPYIEVDNGSYLYFDEYLYKNDKLYRDDKGDWWKEQNTKELIFDDTFTYSFGADFTGFKSIIIQSVFDATTVATMIKEGKQYLEYRGDTSFSAANQFHIDATGKVYITVADSETGWSESIEDPNRPPSAAQVKNFISNKYKMIYRTSSLQKVLAKYEGALRLSKGTNKVTLGEGIILREMANPVLDGDNYYIGNPDVSGSETDYAISTVIEVLKQGKKDDWLIGSDAHLSKALYDSTAFYEITYKVKKRFEVSCHISNVEAEYTHNFHMETREQSKDIQKLEKRISTLEVGLVHRFGKEFGPAIVGEDGIPLMANGRKNEIIIKNYSWKVLSTENQMVSKNGGTFTKKIPIEGIENIKYFKLQFTSTGSSNYLIENNFDFMFEASMDLFKSGRVAGWKTLSSAPVYRLLPAFNKDLDIYNTESIGSFGFGIQFGSASNLRVKRIYFDNDFTELVVVFENNHTTVDYALNGHVRLEVWGN